MGAALPFSGAFEDHRLIERTRRLRERPVAAYGIAVAAVLVASAVRWLVSGQIAQGLTFITYFPAVIIATILGGFWPGVLATALSTIIAWLLFLLPTIGWELGQREVVSLLLFAFVSGINVLLVVLMNAAVDRVIAQEQNVRILIDSAPNGIVVVDEQGTIKLVNTSAEKLFGYSRSDLVGQKIEVLVPESKVAAHKAERDTFLGKPEARAMGAGRDLSGRRKDGSEFPVEIGLNPVSRNGKTGVLATVIDITVRKRAQESQQLIVRELEHRTKNLLAVVHAIAIGSLDEGKTLAEVKHVMRGRLLALAKAYDLLASAAWEGVSIADILHRQIVGFADRLKVSGCDIVLRPSAAQNFALIVYATNALKYGALLTSEGRIAIEGRTQRHNGEGIFSFVWQESDGPPVTDPARKGFGSVILVDAAQQFGQSVAVKYLPQGLRYELHLRLGDIEPSTSSTKAEAQDSRVASLR